MTRSVIICKFVRM